MIYDHHDDGDWGDDKDHHDDDDEASQCIARTLE